jgi:hypothetical protein
MDVEEECKLLVEEIKRLGVEQPSGNIEVTFGTLLDDDRCSQLFEALVGTLLDDDRCSQLFEALVGSLRTAKKTDMCLFICLVH